MNNGSQCGSEGRSLYDFHVEERDKLVSGKGVYVSTTDETSKLANDHPIVKCESTGTESYVDCYGYMKPDSEYNLPETDICPAKVIRDYSKETTCSTENQIDMQGIEQEQKKPFCEGKFTCNDSGLLNPHSPAMESHHEKQQKTESLCPLKCSDSNGEITKSNRTSQVPDVKARAVLAEEVVRCVKTDLDDKSSTQHQQTTGSPFVVSEMSGSHYRKLLSNPVGCSPTSNSVASPKASKECLVANKPESGKFPSVPPGIGKFSSVPPVIGKSSSLPPGIGLHLNTHAAEGIKISEKRQKLAFRRHVTSSPRNLSSLNPDKDSLNPPLASEVVERASEVREDNAQLNKNWHEPFTLGEGIGFLQSAPIQKRRKSNCVGEMDSCRRCSCKRSKCLKLYCQCFEAGVYCTEPCNCQDCFNNPAHEDTVLETRRQIEFRKPLAFTPKVIRSLSTVISQEESYKTPVSATYKKGCNCKKSGCQKKYCECYQRDVGCSLSCRCESCKNTFGRREGIGGTVYEEAKTLKECALDVGSHCEVPKADNENQATREHLNNLTRSASP